MDSSLAVSDGEVSGVLVSVDIIEYIIISDLCLYILYILYRKLLMRGRMQCKDI